MPSAWVFVPRDEHPGTNKKNSSRLMPNPPLILRFSTKAVVASISMPRHPKRSDKNESKRKTVVYHVGSRPVPGGRIGRRFSQEGGELSVSEHPDDWGSIAKLGNEIWQLSKVGAWFLRVPGNRLSKVLAWAVGRGYLIPATVWRVWRGYDDELGEETYFEFSSFDEAAAEAEEYDGDESDEGSHCPGEIEEVSGYRFGPLGETYWRANFDKPVDHLWAESFAPIFYAREHGYDGVWYDERYDPVNLSCPRGLILQEKLPGWEVVRR